MLDFNQRERVFLEREPASSGKDLDPATASGGSCGLMHTTQCLTNFSKSLSVIPQPNEAEDLILLGEKTHDTDVVMSPARYEDVDQNLLDYDSDNGEQAATDGNSLLVRNVQQTTNTSTSETEMDRTARATPDMDAVYYQCNSTRSACRKDTYLN